MTTAEMMPFQEAMKVLAQRDVLPTALDSAGLRQLEAGFHRQNFTSAQTLLQDLLDAYKAKVARILEPVTGVDVARRTTDNPAGFVTAGLDVPRARLEIKDLLQTLGYSPNAGEAGTIKDLASDARINLVLRTNRDVSQGAGWFIQSQDREVLDAFPANELVRIEARKDPRDWRQRWRMAAAVAGDARAASVLEFHGRMIALKSSGIWQALGDGAGGHDDGLGNPFPPFAFNSGMDVRDIAYSEALALELLQPGDTVAPTPLDFTQIFGLAE